MSVCWVHWRQGGGSAEERHRFGARSLSLGWYLWNCLSIVHLAAKVSSEEFKSRYCCHSWGILEKTLVPQRCLSLPNLHLRHVRSVSFHLSTVQSRGDL